MVLKFTPKVETHICHGKSGQESMVSGVTDSIKEVSVWDRQRLMTKISAGQSTKKSVKASDTVVRSVTVICALITSS